MQHLWPVFLGVFGFLGVTFSKEGAAPGAGSVDQPPVVTPALSGLLFLMTKAT